jgi:hypothetical protein
MNSTQAATCGEADALTALVSSKTESWHTENCGALCACGAPGTRVSGSCRCCGGQILPSGYVAPLRVGLVLTTRQRQILQVLAGAEIRPFSSIRGKRYPCRSRAHTPGRSTSLKET